MTNASFKNQPLKTNKTDETDVFVANGEFLATLFGSDNDDKRPVVVSFEGNPHKVSRGAWSGNVWEGQELAPQANNFFSLAAFHPNDAGQYKRQKKYFYALHAIMLDDIGSKVSMDRLTLQPSWLIETSEENFQAGYILSEPLDDPTTADALMKAIVAANLSDPGAGGPTARLARLPVAVNGKTEPAFQCRMAEWQPERKYTADEIITGLELDVQPANQAVVAQASPIRKNNSGDDIFTPRPNENVVIEALKENGLYKTPLGDGRHDITCPWVHEHTGKVDDGAAYFEPNDTYPIGGFKCHHGHCTDRRVRDLLSYLEIELKVARMKPTIRSVAGEIHRISDRAEQELAQSGKHYQRGGLIVTINTDPSTKTTSIKDVSQPSLIASLSSAALWERFDLRSEDWVRIDPPHCIPSELVGQVKVN